ncbi:hypothetical protein SASPL_107752 [Salvia splendens]|uniref:PH domain-containing protein n=1 Tax=Salvia splendens TaxID=180675 RepID=A0A8X8YD04_SALSN|nr:hypothetical protein SASPL_107752 [Salvia splendens]
MADLQRLSVVERDIDQAITSLKRGAHLLKYGRRGKPKFCPFRLSTDESTLIWYYGKDEKRLDLCNVSRRAEDLFLQYPRPEKEYQSFSLIHNDRSLDLESFRYVKTRTKLSWLEHQRSDSTPQSRLGKVFAEVLSFTASSKNHLFAESPARSFTRHSAGAAENSNARTSGTETIRVSLSSALSSSSEDFDNLGDVFIWGDVME